MSRNRPIGIDMDGVLAEFNMPFLDLLTKQTGRRLLDAPEQITMWAWPQHFGYTPAEEAAAWDHIIHTDDFWLSLPELPDAHFLLNALKRTKRPYYFITSRPGLSAKWQTELWLLQHGVNLPTVIIASDKGMAAQLLGLETYVDDNFLNAVGAADAGTKHVYLLSKPYNQFAGSTRVSRITSLMEMIDAEQW